jgi:hypothetical protein
MTSITPVSGILSQYEYQTDFPPDNTRVEPDQSTGYFAQDTAQFSPEALRLAGSKDDKRDAVSGLSAEQQTDIEKLKLRDQEVRTHEQAHIMAGGNLVRGGASYSYRTGPDGKRYATDGEVNIDASPVKGDPRATMRKAQQVRKAALAPAQPSGQDLAVAASASTMEMNAASELTQQTNSQVKAGGSVNRKA